MREFASDAREHTNIRVRYAVIGLGILVVWAVVQSLTVALPIGPIPLLLSFIGFAIGPTLFLIFYPFWAARRCGAKPPLKWLGARPIIREAVIGIGCGIAMTLALGGIEFAIFGKTLGFPEPLRQLVVAQDSLMIISMGLLALTIIPLGEELFFRGLVYGVLRRWSISGSLAAQAFAFALYHRYDLTYSMLIFAAGILFGIVYEWRRTLWAPIFMHLTGNIISFTLLIAAFIAYGNTPVLGVALENHDDGCRITKVFPGSTAEEAGLKTGDIVVKLDDQPISSPSDLISAMEQFELGDQLRLEIKRNGKRMALPVTLNQRRR